MAEGASVAWNTGTAACRVTRVADVDDSGRYWVEAPETDTGVALARLTSTAAARGDLLKTGCAVLVVFDDGSPASPVVVDIVPDQRDVRQEVDDDAQTTERSLKINGKDIVIEADAELVLTCGRSSIKLTRSGKIIIKGDHVLSYARGSNRLRGASIQIN